MKKLSRGKKAGIGFGSAVVLAVAAVLVVRAVKKHRAKKALPAQSPAKSGK